MFVMAKDQNPTEIMEIEVEAVKIIGKIKGCEEMVELLMDADTFYEWKEKIKVDKK